MKRLIKKVITPVTNLFRKVGIGNREIGQDPAHEQSWAGKNSLTLKPTSGTPN
ncbi:MAG: hypothetical protein QGI60_03490 [archaeon]|jgi:hypothetical protein|nr:hypothetical protein [archaeon]